MTERLARRRTIPIGQTIWKWFSTEASSRFPSLVAQLEDAFPTHKKWTQIFPILISPNFPMLLNISNLPLAACQTADCRACCCKILVRSLFARSAAALCGFCLSSKRDFTHIRSHRCWATLWKPQMYLYLTGICVWMSPFHTWQTGASNTVNAASLCPNISQILLQKCYVAVV